MDKHLLQGKFRGCLLGSLMGDCLGGPYEGETVSSGDKIIIQRYFDKMEKPDFASPFKKYTDDTAMMKSVAQFLTDKPDPDYNYLSKLFVDEFFKEPRRGYGQGIVTIFQKLRNSKYEDIFKPAKEQFNGSGSYGNGGAMRIAPVALYYHNDYNNMLNVARHVTKVTHNHPLGVNGALLQCIAVHQALLMDPKNSINPKEFCNELIKKIKIIEEESEEEDHHFITAYQEKLNRIPFLLNSKYDDELEDEILYSLGNGIEAYESVPTAIFCFLKAQGDIPRIETSNILRRTLQYAITLGGDTDTIACMAGAITGAFLGEDQINKQLLSHCEKADDIVVLADALYKKALKS
ncbi:ADP-ribosylhydrolase ARH3-like isoform X2 [Rhynchophorus ferrugineus]